MAATDIRSLVAAMRGFIAPAVDAPAGIVQRANRYGEIIAINPLTTKHQLVDDGSYFITPYGVPGTGVQLNANVTAFSDTNGFVVIQNGATANTRVYLDYLKIIPVGTLPTATTSMGIQAKIDYVSRFPTTAANVALATPVNINADSAAKAAAIVGYFANAGAMTIPASSTAARFAGRTQIATGLGILGDEYLVKFGSTEFSGRSPLTAVRATDVGTIMGHMPAICLGPQQTCVLHMWWVGAATTAATFEVELAHWERAA